MGRNSFLDGGQGAEALSLERYVNEMEILSKFKFILRVFQASSTEFIGEWIRCSDTWDRSLIEVDRSTGGGMRTRVGTDSSFKDLG